MTRPGAHLESFKTKIMEATFKKGDKLRCIDGSFVNLTPNKIYTAMADEMDGFVLLLSDLRQRVAYSSHRFKLESTTSYPSLQAYRDRVTSMDEGAE